MKLEYVRECAERDARNKVELVEDGEIEQEPKEDDDVVQGNEQKYYEEYGDDDEENNVENYSSVLFIGLISNTLVTYSLLGDNVFKNVSLKRSWNFRRFQFHCYNVLPLKKV